MSKLGSINKQSLLVVVAIAAIALTAVLVLHPLSNNSASAIAKKAADYLNANILQNGQTATVVSSSMENGLVKIKMTIGSNSYDMYATADGKLLFPEAFNVGQPAASSTASNSSASATPKTAADLAKADKPTLEEYVVARCPFGLQEQRATDKAINAIPALANYITVRYIGSVVNGKITSMHDQPSDQGVKYAAGAESTENLRQICIRDEQNDKYWNYVSCQMKNGDTAGCEKSTNVDSAKLTACMNDPARGLADAKKDFALDTKYNITGSPTLVLNGQQVSEYDFGGRAPETFPTLICDSSNKKESFCSTKLDTTEAATSFSLTYAPAASSATATTASSGANCAPATPAS